MAIYRITEDLNDASYTLIAIHCVLEDYRLCYFLNQRLQLKLERLCNIKLYEEVSFAIFEWYDAFKDVRWNVLANRSVKEFNKGREENLFGEIASRSKAFLIEEHKRADFFLKIEDESGYENVNDIISKIKKIPQVITAYSVDINQLKIKNQLNFLNNA